MAIANNMIPKGRMYQALMGMRLKLEKANIAAITHKPVTWRLFHAFAPSMRDVLLNDVNAKRMMKVYPTEPGMLPTVVRLGQNSGFSCP